MGHWLSTDAEKGETRVDVRQSVSGTVDSYQVIKEKIRAVKQRYQRARGVVDKLHEDIRKEFGISPEDIDKNILEREDALVKLNKFLQKRVNALEKLLQKNGHAI